MGHDKNFHPTVKPYLSEIEQVDEQIGRVLHALRSRPTCENEDGLILVTTDHGETLDGAHGRNEPAHRTIFYIASGSAAARDRLISTVNLLDQATLRTEFLDDSRFVIGSAMLGPVTFEDRKNEVGGEGEELTGLLFRSTNDALPPATRSIRITLNCETAAGDCDGYADNLSFILHRSSKQ